MHRIADLVGKPFREDGMGPDAYCCWGLAVEVFRRFDIFLPDYQKSCASVASGVTANYEQWVRCTGEYPAPALMVFTTAGICDHVGVYLGGGKFIHAHEMGGVSVVPTNHIFWKKRIEGYYLPGWLP